MVGGTRRSCSASTQAIDSTAPAAPSRCPVIDLVEVTATCGAASPSAVRMASASATSPCGVLVACALMCTTSDGDRHQRQSSAIRIARVAPLPSGSGWAMWWPSAVMPAPATSA